MKRQHRPNPALRQFINGDTVQRLNYLTDMASLAPSPYNTQPWTFLVHEDRILVKPNFERRLSQADPALRGLYFTLGAAVENIILAAHALCLQTKLNISGSGEEFCATITIEDVNKEPEQIDFATIDAIKNRHTNRFAFAQEPLPKALKDFIQLQNGPTIHSVLIDDNVRVGLLQKLTQEAVTQIFNNKKFTKELANWLKSSRAKHEAGMPGYVLGIPIWFSYILPRLVRYGSAKIVTRAQQKVHARWFDSAQTLGYIGAQAETPELIFEAGRVFERIAIEAQKYGVVLGPMSALIEAQGFQDRVRNIFQTQTWPIMIYRIGFATHTPPHSPRYKIHNTHHT